MISRRRLWALLLIFAAGWFCNIGYRHLVRPDEGRYAEIPREMLASGDWLTPRLNGFKYFEKPALQYWATAVSYEIFGINESAARLWPALTGFLGVLLVFYAGRRLFGEEAALLGAAVAASSGMYVFIAHVLTLDASLTFFLSLAVFAFAIAQADETPPRSRRRWMWVGWAAAAFAVLTKGLIGIVLPAGAVALYVLAERDFARLRRLHLLSGGLIFVVIAAPWFIAVSLANPEFFRFFFIHEHFERFLTREHGRYQPPWYFVPVLLGGILPWTLALFPALARAFRREPARSFQPQRFLLAWCAVVFVFFSLSDSKLASYILPIFPAAALLIGRYLVEGERPIAIAQALAIALLGIAATAAAPLAMGYTREGLPAALLERYVPWLVAAGAILAAGGTAALWLAARGRWRASVIAGAAASFVSVQVALSGHEQLSPLYSAYHIVQKIRSRLDPDAPFFVVNTFDHTLPFYLGRTVTMVSYKDELAAPISWEPGKFLADDDAFIRAWKAAPKAYAMFAPHDLAAFLRSHALALRVIARDPRRVIVEKP